LDARIAELVRAGSDEALDALYARYADEIQGVAFLILRDRDEAEDVMAETLITAWRRGRDLRDGGALRPWLMRIATNHALAARRKRRDVRPIDDVAIAVADSTGPLATRIALAAAVDRLPVEMRAAVVLHYFADLSVEDVARALNKSPNTIKSQLRVGLAQLRAAWDERADRRFQHVG
jgi:RNA polymerase sigma-70 factor (ECF subfamily)